MVKTIVRDKTEKASRFGSSDYNLIDAFDKEFFREELGEPFDSDKHEIRKQNSINRGGHRFIAYWVVKKK